MVCLYCSNNLNVANSRPQKRRNQTWRRRHCTACGAVFTSIEAIDLAHALVVDSGGQLQAFDRDRLFISLYESLRHRPTAASDARGLADTVTAHIISDAVSGSIAVQTITSAALNTLRRFDQAAASHYAAFHP